MIIGQSDDCFIKRVGELMNSTFGCVVTEFYNLEYQICSTKIWQTVKANLATFISSAVEECGKSCVDSLILFGFPSERKINTGIKRDKNRHNKTFVHFKIFPTAQIQKSIYSYDFVSMIAEIGGYTGLLLGISVLDISKIFSNYLRMYNLSKDGSYLEK